MPWQFIGGASISPNTQEVVLGGITVPETGGLQVRVVQTSSTPFQFGYCLLGFRSSFGYELGRIRVWPREEFTTYWLGEGLTVTDTQGVLVLEPRTWNLRWVQAGFDLSVAVVAFVEELVPASTFSPNGFANEEGEELPVDPENDLGQLEF